MPDKPRVRLLPPAAGSRLLTLGALSVFLGASPASAGTCALCREALASGGNPGLIQGFYWSILLIGGVSLALLGMVGRLVWRAWRVERPSPR